MALEIIQNGATATVTSGGGAVSAGTVENWTVTTGGNWNTFATGVGQMRVCDVLDVGKTTGYEIMLVTVLATGTGVTWTVTRGVENTTPYAHAANFVAVPVLSAGGLDGRYVQLANLYKELPEYPVNVYNVSDASATLGVASGTTFTSLTISTGTGAFACPVDIGDVLWLEDTAQPAGCFMATTSALAQGAGGTVNVQAIGGGPAGTGTSFITANSVVWNMTKGDLGTAYTTAETAAKVLFPNGAQMRITATGNIGTTADVTPSQGFHVAGANIAPASGDNTQHIAVNSSTGHGTWVIPFPGQPTINGAGTTAYPWGVPAGLSTAITNGAAVTSIAVAGGLPFVVRTGDQILLATRPAPLTVGASNVWDSAQVWVASAPAAVGATSISVTSQNASSAFPAGCAVQNVTYMAALLNSLNDETGWDGINAAAGVIAPRALLNQGFHTYWGTGQVAGGSVCSLDENPLNPAALNQKAAQQFHFHNIYIGDTNDSTVRMVWNQGAVDQVGNLVVAAGGTKVLGGSGLLLGEAHLVGGNGNTIFAGQVHIGEVYIDSCPATSPWHTLNAMSLLSSKAGSNATLASGRFYQNTSGSIQPCVFATLADSNAIQVLSLWGTGGGSPTGTFTLTVGGTTTSAISWSGLSATNIQTPLNTALNTAYGAGASCLVTNRGGNIYEIVMNGTLTTTGGAYAKAPAITITAGGLTHATGAIIPIATAVPNAGLTMGDMNITVGNGGPFGAFYQNPTTYDIPLGISASSAALNTPLYAQVTSGNGGSNQTAPGLDFPVMVGGTPYTSAGANRVTPAVVETNAASGNVSLTAGSATAVASQSLTPGTYIIDGSSVMNGATSAGSVDMYFTTSGGTATLSGVQSTTQHVVASSPVGLNLSGGVVVVTATTTLNMNIKPVAGMTGTLVADQLSVVQSASGATALRAVAL